MRPRPNAQVEAMLDELRENRRAQDYPVDPIADAARHRTLKDAGRIHIRRRPKEITSCAR